MAERCYEAALRVLTPDQLPLDYLRVQQHLAETEKMEVGIIKTAQRPALELPAQVVRRGFKGFGGEEEEVEGDGQQQQVGGPEAQEAQDPDEEPVPEIPAPRPACPGAAAFLRFC